MTTFNLSHAGDDFRIEIEDNQFVMLGREGSGTWKVEARMSMRAAEALASVDLRAAVGTFLG